MTVRARAPHFLKFFVNMYDKINLLIKKIFCRFTHLWSPLRSLHQIVAVLSFVATPPSATNRCSDHK